MPHKPVDKLDLVVPGWVNDLDDDCLVTTLVEALVARDRAIRAGARHHRTTSKELDAADTTVEQIQYGRYEGAAACRKAADALRKYTSALEHAEMRTPKQPKRHRRIQFE